MNSTGQYKGMAWHGSNRHLRDNRETKE